MSSRKYLHKKISPANTSSQQKRDRLKLFAQNCKEESWLSFFQKLNITLPRLQGFCGGGLRSNPGGQRTKRIAHGRYRTQNQECKEYTQIACRHKDPPTEQNCRCRRLHDVEEPQESHHIFLSSTTHHSSSVSRRERARERKRPTKQQHHQKNKLLCIIEKTSLLQCGDRRTHNPLVQKTSLTPVLVLAALFGFPDFCRSSAAIAAAAATACRGELQLSHPKHH